jgi:hypothetical protein
MISQAGLEQLPLSMGDGTFVAPPRAGLETLTPQPAVDPSGVGLTADAVGVPGEQPMTMADRRALALQLLNQGRTPAEIRSILSQMNAAAAENIEDVRPEPEAASIGDVAMQGLRGALEQGAEGIGYIFDIAGADETGEAIEQFGQDAFGLSEEEQAERQRRSDEQGTAGYVGDIVTGAVASSTPMLATAATGAAIGSVVPGVGTAAGALIGAVVGAFPTYVGSGKQRAEENGWDLDDPNTQATVVTTALGLSVAEALFGVGGKTVSPMARNLTEQALSRTALRAGTRNAVEESAQEVAVTMAEIAVFDTTIREQLSEGEVAALVPYVRERYGQEITEAFIGGFGAGAVFSAPDVYRQAQTNNQRREDVRTMVEAARLGGVDLAALEQAAKDPAQVQVLAAGAERIRQAEQQVKKAQAVMQAVQQSGDPAKIAEAQANLVAAAAQSEAAFNSVIPAFGGLDTNQIKAREVQEDQRAKDFLVAEGVADAASMPPLPRPALRGLRTSLEAAKARVTDAETAANDPGLFDPADRAKVQAELKVARDELQKVRDTISLKTGKVTQDGLKVEADRRAYDSAVDWQYENRFAKADPAVAAADAQKIIANASKDPDKGLKAEISRLQKRLDSATTVEEMSAVQKAIAERQARMGREAPLVAAARRFIASANPQQAGTVPVQGSSPAGATGQPAQPSATPVVAPQTGVAVPAAPAVIPPAPPAGTGPAGAAPAPAGVNPSTAGQPAAAVPPTAPEPQVAAPPVAAPAAAPAPSPAPLAAPAAAVPATDPQAVDRAYAQALADSDAKVVTPPDVALTAAPMIMDVGRQLRALYGLPPDATTTQLYATGASRSHTGAERSLSEALGLPYDAPLSQIEATVAARAPAPAAAKPKAPAAAKPKAPAAAKPKAPAPKVPAAAKPKAPAAAKPKAPAPKAPAPKAPAAAKPKTPAPKAPAAAKPKAPKKPVSLRDRLEEESKRLRPPPSPTAPVQAVAGDMPKQVPVKVSAATIANLAPTKSNGGRGYTDEFPLLRQTHVTEAQAIKFMRARTAKTGNEHAIAFYADTGEAVQVGTSGKHGSVGTTVALSLAMRQDRPLTAIHTHPPISDTFPYSSSFSPADFAVTAVAGRSRTDPTTHREIVLKDDGGQIEFSFTPKGATEFEKVTGQAINSRLQSTINTVKRSLHLKYTGLTSPEALYIASEALTRALDKHGLITYKVKTKSKFETSDKFKGAIEYAERAAYEDVGARFSLRRSADGKRADVEGRLGRVQRPRDLGSEGPGIARVDLVDQGETGGDGRDGRVRESGSEGVTGSPYETGPLRGLPAASPGPNPRIVKAAEDYLRSAGLPVRRQSRYVTADPERGKRIADAFEAMPDNPRDPEVAAAYKAMADETVAQYRALMTTGMKVEMWKPGMKDPYPKGPKEAILDMRENNHLWVFPTEGGFGQTPITAADRAVNPMLAVSEFTDANGRPMLVNDLFRAVHDAFGHGREGVGFGANGEENTWQSHVRMFTPLAARAMTTETRGQNSWVNFGPHGEHNRANQRDTIYAPQKIGLLPDFVMTEGVEDAEPTPFMERMALAETTGDVTPVFYSPAYRGVETAKIDTAPGQDWKAMLKAMPGVKKAEIEWLGVNEWLDAQPGQVMKADLLDYINANTIQVETSQFAGDDRDPPSFNVVTGEALEPDWAYEAENYRDDAIENLLESKNDERDPDDPEVTEADLDEDEIMDAAMAAARDGYDWSTAPVDVSVYASEDPDFEWYGTYYPDMGEYQIDGLGTFDSTYAVEDAAQEAWKADQSEPEGVSPGVPIIGEAQFRQYIEDGHEDAYREIVITSPSLHVSGPNQGKSINPYYHGGHFDVPNVLVHARVSERGGTNGEKVYFVEEIQSDLSSDWRKRPPAEIEAEFRRLVEDMGSAQRAAYLAKEQMQTVVGNAIQVLPEVEAVLYAPTIRGGQGALRTMYVPAPREMEMIHLMVTKGVELPFNGDPNPPDWEGVTGESIRTWVAERVYTQDPAVQSAVASWRTARDTADAAEEAQSQFIRSNPGQNLQGLRPQYPQTPFMGEGAYSLAVKRLLRDAALTNADAFAWTPGYMQAERWNTAAQNVVQNVEWQDGSQVANEDSKPFRVVRIATRNERHPVFVDEAGKITWATVDAWEGETLSRLVGQSLAQRIMAEPNGDVSGANVAFQNSGYAIAYDQQIKRNVEAFVKKFGGKVEESTGVRFDRIGRTNEPRKVWMVKLTPEMKEAALRPFPLFMRDPGAADAPRANLTDADIETITQDLRADLRDMNLDDAIPLTVVKRLTDLAGDEVFGYAEGGRITVNASAAPGARGVMRHEIIHALRDPERWGSPFGLFTDAEWGSLEAAARADAARMDATRRNYADDNLTEAQIVEEVIAERFRDWASRRDTTVDPDGIFAKVKAFLQAVAQALFKRGARAEALVFDNIANGNIGSRVDRRFDAPGREGGPAQMKSIVAKDNPGGKWLERKIEDVEAAMRRAPAGTATEKGIAGATTAYTRGAVMLPVNMVTNLPGAMDENRVPGDPKYDRLMEKIDADGWKEDQDGNAILIGVNHRGEAYIVEGNTRTAAATALGVPDIRAEVRWYNGGESQPGPITPDTVNAAAKPAPDSRRFMRSPLADPPPLVDVPEWLDIKTAHGSAIKDTYDLMTNTKRRSRLLERLETNVVNAFVPIRNLELQQRGQLGTGMDSAFKSAEIAVNDTGRNETLMHYGAAKLGPNGEFQIAEGTIGIRPMLDKLGKGQAVVDWMRYMAARRAKELKARGIELPVDDAAISDGLALKSDVFDEVAADWKKFNDANIDFLVDTGRITRTTANALKAQSAYIPLYRSDELVSGEIDIFDLAELESPRGGGAMIGQHLLSRDPGIKKIKGGTEHKVNNIIENMVRNSRAIVAAGMRNRATNLSVDLMREAGYVKVTPAFRTDPVSGARYAVPAPRGDSITMWDKGQEHHVSIETPEGAVYMTALMGMRPLQLQGIMRFMAQVGSFFRQSITLSPGFIARNLIRDTVSTAVLTGGQNLGRNNTLSGLKASARTHASRQAFMAQSGMGDFRFGMPEVGASSDAMMIELGILPKTAWSRIGKGIDWMEEQGTRVEMSNRLAYYQAQIDKGVRPDEAAYQALTLINYNRRGAGAGVRLLTVLVPFLNARIQGLARLAEDATAKRGPERRKALTQLAVSGAVLGAINMALWAWNNGEEERREKYENEPLYRRLNYHIIYGPGDSKFLIPRAFEIGAVFGTLPEIAFEEIQSRMAGEPSETKRALTQILLSTFGFNPVPQAMLPAMEVIANYDAFRGQPIEGARVQGVLREDRIDPYTTATGAALAQTGLARTLDLSPLEIDHLGFGYGGVFYSLMTAATDSIATNLGLLPARPATVLSAVPGAQATFGSMVKDERDDAVSRDFERYFEVRQAVDNIYNSAKQAVERRDIERARQLLTDAPATIEVYKFLNSVERDISEVTRAMRNIRLDPNLSSREKQARLRPLIARRNTMVGQVMRIIDEAEKRQGTSFRTVAA